MSFFDSLERNFLFILTRFLALLIIVSLLIAIVVGGIMFSEKLFPKNDTKVTPTEVIEAIHPSDTYTQSQPGQQQAVIDVNILPGIKMPFILQKYFNTPESIKVLKEWLEKLPKGQRNEFINELAATVEQIEKTGTNIDDAINKYAELKLSKLSDSKLAEAEASSMRLKYVGVAFGGVGLIALFSLILVLLAIERNTRKGVA